MILHLLRHAEAEDTRGAMSDAERALTPHGRSEAERLAEKLATRLEEISLILASPVLRARTTANIFANALGKTDLIQEVPWLASGSDPHHILRHLQDFQRETELMLVGHEPWISQLTSLLISGHAQSLIKIRKLGLVTLRIYEVAAQGAVLLRLR